MQELDGDRRGAAGALKEELIELNGNGRDVDAIVQVGTNLSMVRLAAAAEDVARQAGDRDQHCDLRGMRCGRTRSWTRFRGWAGCWREF